MNPSGHVLQGMKKTNIWPSAVGSRPLNGCAAGKEHRTLAVSATSHPAKCDNLCLGPQTCIFRHPAHVAGLWKCVCVILLIEVLGLCCCSKLVTYLKASN